MEWAASLRSKRNNKNMSIIQHQNLIESLRDWADEALLTGASPDKVIDELAGKVELETAIDIVRSVRKVNDLDMINDPRNQV